MLGRLYFTTNASTRVLTSWKSTLRIVFPQNVGMRLTNVLVFVPQFPRKLAGITSMQNSVHQAFLRAFLQKLVGLLFSANTVSPEIPFSNNEVDTSVSEVSDLKAKACSL